MIQTLSPEEAVSHISNGSKIYVSGNAATPKVTLEALVRRAKSDPGTDVEVLSNFLLGVDPIFDIDLSDRIKHTTFFCGPVAKDAVNDKGHTAEYLPIHLSDLPRYIKDIYQPDVIIVSVSAPVNGRYSLSTSTEALPDAIRYVKSHGGKVIAEVNPNRPFIEGEAITSEQIDYLVETDYEMPGIPLGKIDEKARKIAELIVDNIIKSGYTLQFGFGPLPEAIADALIARKDKIFNLGIHTEVFSTAMQRLVDAGMVTNVHKQEKASTAAFWFGSGKNDFHWYHGRKDIKACSVTYTNNAGIIRAQPNLVAINNALGVDLDGRVIADAVLREGEEYIINGLGGQADFIRNAKYPVIVLTSTAGKPGSEISRITLDSPQGITQTVIPHDGAYIVTEYGMVNTFGLTRAQKAYALIQIAHPDFRQELMEGAVKKFGKKLPSSADLFPQGSLVIYK